MTRNIFYWSKRRLIACLTRNPYRVAAFKELYRAEPGAPLDIPETSTGILLSEPGGVIGYYREPKCLNGPIHLRYMGKKPRYQASGIFREPDRYVYSMADAGIVGQLGLVYDGEKRSFIDESAREWLDNIELSPYVNAFRLPVKTGLGGITLSFLTIGADGGFYHFLLESIVKAGMYGSLLAQADHLLFNGPVADWKLKWLNRAGMDTSKIIWMDGRSHYECRQLLFTNRLIADQQIGPWCLNALKKIFEIPEVQLPGPPEKKIILISRKGLKSRELVWENEILARFPEIESVDFSQLDTAETIAAMQNATHVIGPHGAGLSNIYLCRPGTKILEIYPGDVSFQPCYQRIAAVCSLDYALMYLNFNQQHDPAMGLNTFAEQFLQFTC
ncbi:glycosyltransferase family 61 protein [Mucilaginibacter sp. AW1-7]|uniref:glycosyltransferase family 61 protein n=1 Tax=Mucilaginibacter sp. AW1-7 TaxID=3349874 RepID=UPI003F733E49